MWNFRERLRTLRTGLSVRPISRLRFIRCAFLDGCRLFFCTARCSRIRSCHAGKAIDFKRLAHDSLIYPVSDSTPIFLWAMFFCQEVTEHCALAGSADSPLFIGVTTPHHRGSVANMAWDRLSSVSRMPDNFWVLSRGANCTYVYLARLIAGVKKAGLDVHDVHIASGSADVLRV